MVFHEETEMKAFAENLGRNLVLNPTEALVLELVGDVGVGKTTFASALAKGLGVVEPVTSPSFTISKHYALPGGEFIHYDFYRLEDPGIMASELSECLTMPNSVIVVEWGESVKKCLPDSRVVMKFKLLPDGARELTIKNLT